MITSISTKYKERFVFCKIVRLVRDFPHYLYNSFTYLCLEIKVKAAKNKSFFYISQVGFINFLASVACPEGVNFTHYNLRDK